MKLLTVAIALLGMIGCQSSSAPSDPKLATLEVIVKAEPRKGGKNTKVDYGVMPTGQWSVTDWDSLDEIVVIVEPQVLGTPAPPIEIDLTKRHPLVQVVSSQGGVSLKNGGLKSESVFMRDENGVLIPIGVVAPGKVTTVSMVPSGYFELCVGSREAPVARCFGYARGIARICHAGERVTLANLSPGNARISTWHPRLPGMSKEVALEAGKTTRVDATVSVNNLKASK